MGKTVLIIDDDLSVHDILSAHLTTHGYTVRDAFDGLQGTMQAQKEHPDIIILDFEMPGGGGPMIFERLRQNAFTGSIPVVFLSSLRITTQQEQVPPTRNARFLQKPIDIPALTAMMQELLG